MSQVLQYFGKVRHNSTSLDAFSKVTKVTNHTGLWEAKLTWYLPNLSLASSTVLESMLFGLPYFVWLLRVLQTKQNLLNHLSTVEGLNKPSPFAQQMFLVTSVVSWLSFQLIKHKFLYQTTLHIYLCSFQITYRKSNAQCQCTNYHSRCDLNSFGYGIY